LQQELEFQLSQITLKGVGYGDPSKPLILALHGWLDNAASFEPIASYLPDYYIVAIDLAGHGLSQHRSLDAHYHFVDFVHDIHELVSTQSWQSFILMGHSMGGIIASLYASTFTDNVKQLISIESFGPMTKEASSSPEQLKESINSRLQVQKSLVKPLRSFKSTVRARALVGELSEAAARVLVQRNVKDLDGKLYFRSDKRLRTFSSLRMTDEQAKAFMLNIACPVLVISAEQGYEFVQDAVQQRFTWLKEVTHVSCPGHHHLHMDNAQVVAKQIQKFLLSNESDINQLLTIC
jgi:pimeloyl-ACP methyl ester carboxylesterase